MSLRKKILSLCFAALTAVGLFGCAIDGSVLEDAVQGGIQDMVAYIFESLGQAISEALFGV